MTTTLLWLLIAVSEGGNNAGNVSVVARFVDVRQCESTRQAIAAISRRVADNAVMRCVQAEVVQ